MLSSNGDQLLDVVERQSYNDFLLNGGLATTCSHKHSIPRHEDRQRELLIRTGLRYLSFPCVYLFPARNISHIRGRAFYRRGSHGHISSVLQLVALLSVSLPSRFVVLSGEVFTVEKAVGRLFRNTQ
jgi:hypothetical protein